MSAPRVPRLLVFHALALMLAGSAAVASAGTATLDDLQSAYNLELNARAQYLAYASQAAAEGYLKAASLFRATARAEEIHANLHAEAIQKLGGTPSASIETPHVKSTRDNLSAAIARESYERDRMYALYAGSAHRESCGDAEHAFGLARNAESQHAKLFSEARAGLHLMKQAQAFYVCPGCGATMVEPESACCESCGVAIGDFVITM
jgi:rubrerythrin